MSHIIPFKRISNVSKRRIPSEARMLDYHALQSLRHRSRAIKCCSVIKKRYVCRITSHWLTASQDLPLMIITVKLRLNSSQRKSSSLALDAGNRSLLWASQGSPWTDMASPVQGTRTKAEKREFTCPGAVRNRDGPHYTPVRKSGLYWRMFLKQLSNCINCSL